MTLLETERMVRKIAELLRQNGSIHVAPKLAEDFAAACHGANLRLQQCEAMIRAKDQPQALQLAETAPNLLDVVTLLEFLGCDEWRDYCQRQALPVAERIDARAVQALNECYGQGITTDHPLYALYRRAVLSRNDEAALRSLQSIARLNPGDNNAAAELERLDAKVLAQRLNRIGQTLPAVDIAPLLTEIEGIEEFGFRAKPQGDIWRQAQAIRCGHLLSDAAKARNSNDWMEALAKLDFIERLKSEFDVELAAADPQRIETLESWARAEQEKDRTEREFAGLIGELNRRIDESEEKDTSARYVELPELRDDFEGLHKVWRALVDFTRTIPEEVGSRFRKRSALLESEIARRTALRRRAIFATVAAALLIVSTVGWWVLRQGRILDFTAQLRAAVEQRQTHSAEKLLERLSGRDQTLLSVGRVNTAAGQAEALVNKERALLTNFDSSFARLPQHLDGPPEAAQLGETTERLAAAHKALDALAPDLKAENEPRVEAFDRQWQRYCADAAGTINQRLDPWVAQAEKECQSLNYLAPISTATAEIGALSSLLGKTEDCESSFTNHLQLRGDLLERTSTSRAKLTAYQRELKKLDDGIAAVRKARTIKEFSDGLRIITSSEFSASPEAVAASAIVNVGPNEETALRALLGASSAGAWACLTRVQPVDFVPQAAMPAERDILKQLSQDPAIGPEHWRYRFWLNAKGTRNVEWVTTGALATTTGWQRIKAWVPAESPDFTDFQDHEYGYFDGQYRLSPTELVYQCEQVGSVPDRGSFRSLGLQKLWPGGSTYSGPLLGVLDSLKASHESSPLLRAYLFLRLTELMSLQPDAWGVTFCPSLTADAYQLRGIGGEHLLSGDWFVETKEKMLGPKFERFFTSIEAISYTKQAAGLVTVERAAARDGLQYAGFIDLTGQPALVEAPAGRQLWAYSSAPRSQLVRLGSEGSRPGGVMRLSPVFTLPKAPRQYLAEAGVALDDPSFKGILPPLFQESTPSQP